MSDNTEANRKSVSATSLPQFMSETTNLTEIEEKPSWLNNNLHKLMVSVSVIWFGIVLIYITQFFGWDNLFLMMPDEFGGFLAGITLPLAIIWVVMAYIDRGTSFKQEAKFLRAYMNQLVYPEDGAPQTAKAMADAIRSQVVELQEVNKMATMYTEKIKDEIRANINDFSKLVATLDNYSSKTIVELSDGVKYLTQNFENVTNKAQHSVETFADLNKDFASDAIGVEQSLNNLMEKVLPKIKEINASAKLLDDISSHSTNNIEKANNELSKAHQLVTSNLGNITETLNAQSQNLQQISAAAVSNSNLLKKTFLQETDSLQDIIDKHTTKLEGVIQNSSDVMRGKVDELSKQALSQIDVINSNVEKGLNNIDNSINNQVKKIDSVILKNNHDLTNLVGSLDKHADQINKKLYEYGDILAQEIDKLMIRGNNLEESINIQVGNLKNISADAVSSMKEVDTLIENNIVSLQNKTQQAHSDLALYVDAVEDKSIALNRLTADIMEKIQLSTDNIQNKHNYFNELTSKVFDQLENMNDELKLSADNLQSCSDQSVRSLQDVANNMNDCTTSLSEATSVVVAQSQVSEASLALQHKNITSSAARVEELKSEFRQQMDELSVVSSDLGKEANLILEKLKSGLNTMLVSCNDVINKSKVINDNLTDQANMFDTSANRTLAKVTQFENVLTTQNQNIELLAQNVSERANNIESILSQQNKQVNEISSSALAAFRKAADEFETQNKSLHNISRSTAEYISGVASGLDEKAATLNTLFKQQENEFYNFCDKISDNAEKMSESLRQQVGIIEQSADKVFSRMVMLEEDTSRHTEAVVNNTHKSIDRLMEIETMVGNKNDIIRKMADEAASNLENVSSKLQDNIQSFGVMTKDINEKATIAASGIIESCSRLQNVEDDLTQTTINTSRILEEQVKSVDVAMVKAKNQHEDINKMLSNQIDNMTEVANTLSTQSRLAEASLAQQYKYLTDTVSNVAQKTKEISDSFQSNTNGVFETANKLSYEFDVLGDRIIKAGEDINKVSKNSLKSIDQVNISLTQNSEDLDMAIKHSIEKMGIVFNEYDKYIAGFNTVTAETSTGVVEINNLISSQRDKMVQISDDTKKLVDCFNTVLNDTSNQLSERANQAYDKVKSLGKDLKNLGLQMEEAAKVSATHMLNSGDKLRASVAEIAANAERISNDILNSGEVFVKQSNALVSVSDDTISKVNSAMGNLLEVCKDFSISGDTIIKDALRFSDIIGTQLKDLSEQSAKADNSLKNLTTTYQGIQIEAFLKQAGSIIEKLESLSVDINRVFNPKDEEDLWKKFYNGDTGVFVRYLSKNINKMQVSTVRKAFENNTDFRNQVSAYLSEFELLINQAKDHEHSGLLLSVITGADIGKLYYVLAKIMDKLN